MSQSRAVEIIDVGPRDGLQTEDVCLPVASKIELIGRLARAGAQRIEVASFVDARRVPQMADAEAIVAGLPADGFTKIGLVLNDRGAERALSTAVDQLGLVCAATDTFALRNQGMPSEQTVDMASRMIALARAHGRSAQVTITVAFGCPYEGRVEPDRVVELARRLAASGPVEIALADTIGVAAPCEVEAMVSRVIAAIAPLPVRLHFHDTRSAGVANVWAAYRAGARIFDASIGGLGGCPFAPGAAGNVATEDVHYLFERSGLHTGLDAKALADTASWLHALVKRPA